MKVVAALGDYYHERELLVRSLSEAIEEIEDIDLIYASRENLFDELKQQPDLVILGSENRLNPEEENVENWLTDSEASTITGYVKNGGTWFAWHSGLASYDSVSSYIDMLGGCFAHHPDDHVSVKYHYKRDHELSAGKGPFEIIDEHYFIKRIHDVSLFLESTSEYGDSTAGWTRKYGEGKVCCYIPAHNREGLMDPSVQTDLKDIINWLLK